MLKIPKKVIGTSLQHDGCSWPADKGMYGQLGRTI